MEALAKYFTFEEAKRLPVFNWLYYKEGFSPQLVWWAIEVWQPRRVYDPFMGSGTALLAAKAKGVESEGVDVSPLSLLAARVKLRDYEEQFVEEGLEILRSFDPKKESRERWWYELFPPERAFPRRNLQQLLSLREQIAELEEKYRDFLMLALLSILPQVSLVVKDGGVLRIRREKRATPVWELFKRKVKRMLREAPTYSNGTLWKAQWGDAKEYVTRADLIITSPPYLNNVDYSKVYGLELSFLGFDPREVRGWLMHSSIRREPKVPKEGELPIATAYLEESREVLERLYNNLEEGGHVVYVVADAVIKGHYIPVLEKLEEMAGEIGFNVERRLGTLKRKVVIEGRVLYTRESALHFTK